MTMLCLVLVACWLVPSLALAHGTTVETECYRPFPPIAEDFLDRGDTEGLRASFETYFDDVETYLNCLNAESARIRAEGQRAANDYGRLLDRLPPSPWTVQPEEEQFDAPARPEMRDSGSIILSPQG